VDELDEGDERVTGKSPWSSSVQRMATMPCGHAR
jgi:hypothetical protein